MPTPACTAGPHTNSDKQSISQHSLPSAGKHTIDIKQTTTQVKQAAATTNGKCSA
jgi:hypothetical protein